MVFQLGSPRRAASPLDFSDGGDRVPLTPNAFPPSNGSSDAALDPPARTRFTRFAGVPHRGPVSPSTANFPPHLRRNKSERQRLQGLMGGGRLSSVLPNEAVKGEAEKPMDWLARSDSDVSGSSGASGSGSGGFGSSAELSKSDLRTGVAKDSARHRIKIWMLHQGGTRVFVWTWVLVHLLVFGFGFVNYQLKDNLNNARATFHITYPIARAAALVLHVDVAFILLPVCRNFITLLLRSALNKVVPFERNVTFHKLTGWSICFWSLVHIVAHMVNFVELARVTRTGVVGFIGANFLTGPGMTGWIMTVALGLMSWTAREKARRKKFERFWYTHHLFILFFVCWQLHGMFCMIKPDRPPYCDFMQIGVFWKYWLVGGVIFLWERILREVRSRHRTYISKVIQHPSRVCEIQIKKEKTPVRAGQYVFLNCPEISFWQWHPFTLTSAPEEDYLSLHIRCVGDFTTQLAEALGCDFSRGKEKLLSRIGPIPAAGEIVEGQRESVVVQPPTNRVLPRVMLDGPFGSASEDVFEFETVILVGGGIGVTPFASILKSIWYRLNSPQQEGGPPTRLQKVYFFWVCRDFDSFEWFKSLLEAIEEQDVDRRVELHTYITAKLKDDDISNIMVSDVGGERDAVTRLRSPTHYGRPNWDRIFSSVRDRHPATDVGVFFCGPKPLGHALHLMCDKWTGGSDLDTRFRWSKENF